MTQPRSSPHDLPETEEEYRRWCTLQNPAFIEAKREFLKRWQSEPDLFAESILVARKAERGKGWDAIREQQRKQGRFLSELVKFCNAWPSITPGDIIAAASTTPGPKVRLAPYSPLTWPRDGSLLLCVYPTATGDEIKKAWREIKTAIQQGKAKRLSGQRRLKSEIYELYYDRGMKFPAIAKKLKKPVSTVAYLLGSVCRDTGRVSVRGQKRMDSTFDYSEHSAGCAECKRVGVCPLAEEKMGIKEHGLREVLVEDITQAERRQLRLEQGRKRPRKIDY